MLGSVAKEGESPVHERRSSLWSQYLSTVGHVKSCGKLGRPFPKAKYVIATDSEEVP